MRVAPPSEKRLAGVFLTRDEVLRGRKGFLADGFHPLFGQRAGVSTVYLPCRPPWNE
jgi:hypothetical protein